MLVKDIFSSRPKDYAREHYLRCINCQEYHAAYVCDRCAFRCDNPSHVHSDCTSDHTKHPPHATNCYSNVPDGSPSGHPLLTAAYSCPDCTDAAPCLFHKV